HRDEPPSPRQEGGRLLQRARNGGAVDQGRQERGQVDATVVHGVPRERRPAPAPCAGLQPRQLPAHPGVAGGRGAVVTDKPTGEGGEDRCQGRGPWVLPRVPDGGGGGAPRAVRPHPGPDREAASAEPGPMLTLDGRGGGGPGVEMRPECVHGVPKSRRKSLGEVPEARGGRQEGGPEQKALAFEATRAVSRLRDGAVHLGNVGVILNRAAVLASKS